MFYSNVEKLGDAVYKYFIKRIAPGESFYLCIDSFVYEKCAKDAGLSDKEIERLLAGEGINYNIPTNEYALGIVALQIKIAFDIETEDEFQNSYYQRLIKNIAFFNTHNDVQTYFASYQDSLWLKVKNYFLGSDEKEKRYLRIPEPKEYAGRYVQYPKSQRIASSKEIIAFAECFIQYGLEPNSGITYETFKHSFFEHMFHTKGDMYTRMIFSFYCMWDGRSSEEILNHQERETSPHYISPNDDYSIKLSPSVKIYKNKEELDLSKTTLRDCAIHWTFYDFKTKSENPKKCFIQDENYNDWISSRFVEENQEILLITMQHSFPKYISDLIISGEIEIIDAGLYKLLLLTLKSRESYEKLGLPLKPIPDITLIGGLKTKRNTYLNFALPVVSLLDKSKKFVYIDNIKCTVSNGICYLPQNIKIGKHTIILGDSWEASEYHFSIEEAEIMESNISHGWLLDYDNSLVSPVVNPNDAIIEGIELKQKLYFINHFGSDNNDSEQKYYQRFMNHKNKLENRFNCQ